MANSTTSTLDYLYKRLYSRGLDKDILESGNQLLKWVTKDTKFASSQGKVIPVPHTNQQGIGSTHATAATAARPGKGVAFLVTQSKMVNNIPIDGDVVQNAQNGGDEAQFIDAFMFEIDGATKNFGQELNQRLYGDVLGGRALVHASTAPSTTTLTLANPSDTQFFEIGMLVSAYDTAAGTIRNAGASVEITGVNPVAGTLTGSTNWTTTIGALAVGDTLVRANMFNASISGLRGWVPTTVAGGDSFFGVNRSVYRERLAGVYYDASGYNVRSGFINAFAFAETQLSDVTSGEAPIFMHPLNAAQLVQSVEGVKVVDIKLTNEYNVGLDAIQVLGRTIVKDRHCPVNNAFIVPKGAFTLGTAGKYDLETKGGSKFFFDPDVGTVKASILMLGNGYSTQVNRLMRFALPTV